MHLPLSSFYMFTHSPFDISVWLMNEERIVNCPNSVAQGLPWDAPRVLCRRIHCLCIPPEYSFMLRPKTFLSHAHWVRRSARNHMAMPCFSIDLYSIWHEFDTIWSIFPGNRHDFYSIKMFWRPSFGQLSAQWIWLTKVFSAPAEGVDWLRQSYWIITYVFVMEYAILLGVSHVLSW